jgi:hypothetical protein
VQYRAGTGVPSKHEPSSRIAPSGLPGGSMWAEHLQVFAALKSALKLREL